MQRQALGPYTWSEARALPLLTVALACCPSGLSVLRLALLLLLVPVNATLLSSVLLLNSWFLKRMYSQCIQCIFILKAVFLFPFMIVICPLSRSCDTAFKLTQVAAQPWACPQPLCQHDLWCYCLVNY